MLPVGWITERTAQQPQPRKSVYARHFAILLEAVPLTQTVTCYEGLSSLANACFQAIKWASPALDGHLVIEPIHSRSR